jgi:hypothetical protein
MKQVSMIAAVAFAALASAPATAEEIRSTPIVSGGDVTVVNVFPTSPQAFVPVTGLPSYLVMPGSAPLSVATEVIYTNTVPADSVQRAAGIDVNCANFNGTVQISGPDVFSLDKDGDGIGCGRESDRRPSTMEKRHERSRYLDVVSRSDSCLADHVDGLDRCELRQAG